MTRRGDSGRLLAFDNLCFPSACGGPPSAAMLRVFSVLDEDVFRLSATATLSDDNGRRLGSIGWACSQAGTGATEATGSSFCTGEFERGEDGREAALAGALGSNAA